MSECTKVVENLVACGKSLSRTGNISANLSAGLGAARERKYIVRLNVITQSYATKYRSDILRLAELPAKETGLTLDRFSAREKQSGESDDVIELIRVHLRLCRANNPPPCQDIIRDFGALYLLKHGEWPGMADTGCPISLPLPV